MFCRKCGAQFGDEDRFCPSCGTEVIKTENIPNKASEENVPAIEVVTATAHAAPKKNLVPLFLLVAAVVVIIVAFIFLGGNKGTFDNYGWNMTRAEVLKEVEANGFDNISKKDESILYIDNNFWGVTGASAAVVFMFEDDDQSLSEVNILVGFDSKIACQDAYKIYSEKMLDLHGEPVDDSNPDVYKWETKTGNADIIVADTLLLVDYYQEGFDD